MLPFNRQVRDWKWLKRSLTLIAGERGAALADKGQYLALDGSSGLGLRRKSR